MSSIMTYSENFEKLVSTIEKVLAEEGFYIQETKGVISENYYSLDVESCKDKFEVRISIKERKDKITKHK